MKIKKFEQINENYSMSNIQKILNDYFNFKEYIKPLILFKYDEIVEEAKNDDDYEVDSGDVPFKVNHERLYLVDVYNAGVNIEAELALYDKYDKKEAEFVIPITPQDIKKFPANVKSKKYNL
jgi:hypothetical protein